MYAKNLPIVDWSQIESSAPGKFIISGEYSVVYEKQAIASAIDLRTKVVIRPNEDGKVRLNMINLNSSREWPTSSFTMCRLVSKYSDCLDFDDTMPIKLNHLLHSRYNVSSTLQNKQSSSVASQSNPQAASSSNDATTKDTEKKADDATMAFLLLYIGLGDSYASCARPSIDVEIESTVPVGSGLGSSSALAVALCGSLMRVFRVVAEKYIISNWAFNVDKFFHGSPSGVDNNITTNGSYILFQNGKIKAFGVSHRSPIRVMLIDTGVSRSTRALCENVAAQVHDDPNKINGIFNSINDCTSHIWRKMSEPNFAPKNIAPFLRANQDLLNELGVGHEKLTDICTRAQQLNLTAKQTGAGGGGTAFVLYDDSDNCEHITQLRSDLIEAGYSVHDHTIGCDGLLVKISPSLSSRASNMGPIAGKS